jgi:hypothetical protein
MSRKRGDSLNDDVKLFFALGNAVMDASIAAWAWKFKIDYVRPITGIREYFRGQAIVSWLGPYRGYGPVKGENWIPYQEPTVVTRRSPSTCPATRPSAPPGPGSSAPSSAPTPSGPA